MLASPYAQLRAIRSISKVNGYPTIKEALEAIEYVNNKHIDKLNIQIDNMLRKTDIEECKKLMKGL